MKQMNIAVVAFGRIAKVHILAAYMANLKMELPFELRVSHIITSRPEDVPFNNVHVCTSLEEALHVGEEIDIVDVCNINETHYREIEIATLAEKAIYCEKPLTDNIEDSKKACDLIKKHNIKTGVPLIFRYIPCLHMLKSELGKKNLGNIINVEAKYYHNGYLNPLKRQTWRTKKTSGGGASIDLGIHIVDSMRFLFGDFKTTNQKTFAHFDDVETDEVYYSDISLEGKGIGSITASRIYHQENQTISIEVFCEKGSYFCDLQNPYRLKKNDFFGNTVSLKANNNEVYMRYMTQENLATYFHQDAHMSCLADFARYVAEEDYGGYFADFNEAYLSQKKLLD